MVADHRRKQLHSAVISHHRGGIWHCGIAWSVASAVPGVRKKTTNRQTGDCQTECSLLQQHVHGYMLASGDAGDKASCCSTTVTAATAVAHTPSPTIASGTVSFAIRSIHYLSSAPAWNTAASTSSCCLLQCCCMPWHALVAHSLQGLGSSTSNITPEPPLRRLPRCQP